MTPLSHAFHTSPAVLARGGDNEDPPIANLPNEVFATNIFPYLGPQDLSHAGQVCRRFTILGRTTRQRRAQDLCQACAGLFASFGITPIGPNPSSKEAASFLKRTVRRVKKINDLLPGDLRSQFSAHDLVCKVGPGHTQEFLQKAYDHSLRTVFGEMAHVPENASLEEAVRRIKGWLHTAGAVEIPKLRLGFRELCCLPREIWQLTALQQLDLHGNHLASLPPEIGRLTALQKLYLNYCHITSLPPEIGQLTALQTLDLSDNQLTSLPPEIGRLTALRQLDLSDNQLTSLPPEIGQLTALQCLRLYENQLTALPPEIGRLTALQKLYLEGNQLSSLLPEIDRLTALLDLGLARNKLTYLPSEIGRLTALRYLGLGHNKLASLPPEIGQLTALRELYLGYNQLTSLPPEIGRLTALHMLYLERNRLTSLPPEMDQLTTCVMGLGRQSLPADGESRRSTVLAHVVSAVRRAGARVWRALLAPFG